MYCLSLGTGPLGTALIVSAFFPVLFCVSSMLWRESQLLSGGTMFRYVARAHGECPFFCGPCPPLAVLNLVLWLFRPQITLCASASGQGAGHTRSIASQYLIPFKG